MTLAGLLHSDIHGSMPTYGSPWLFAVSRVLLRLPVPRHSPCALCSLTMCSLFEYLKPLQISSNRLNLAFEIAVITSTSRLRLISENNFSISIASALFSFQGSTSFLRFATLAFCSAKPVNSCKIAVVLLLRSAQITYSTFKVVGGLKWTRTTDLTLIRRAL